MVVILQASAFHSTQGMYEGGFPVEPARLPCKMATNAKPQLNASHSAEKPLGNIVDSKCLGQLSLVHTAMMGK